jgi:transposase InsO family protein
MAQGFTYLVAVMDWHSRFVLSWSLSLTMELDFCLEALRSALRRGRPEIFNSDQGSQFTSEKFTGELAARCYIRQVRRGPGGFLGNTFVGIRPPLDQRTILQCDELRFNTFKQPFDLLAYLVQNVAQVL